MSVTLLHNPESGVPPRKGEYLLGPIFICAPPRHDRLYISWSRSLFAPPHDMIGYSHFAVSCGHSLNPFWDYLAVFLRSRRWLLILSINPSSFIHHSSIIHQSFINCVAENCSSQPASQSVSQSVSHVVNNRECSQYDETTRNLSR